VTPAEVDSSSVLDSEVSGTIVSLREHFEVVRRGGSQFVLTYRTGGEVWIDIHRPNFSNNIGKIMLLLRAVIRLA